MFCFVFCLFLMSVKKRFLRKEEIPKSFWDQCFVKPPRGTLRLPGRHPSVEPNTVYLQELINAHFNSLHINTIIYI